MDKTLIITEFVVGASGLLIVWAVVGNMVFKPVLKLLDSREKATAGAEHDSEELKIKATMLRTEVEQELRSARQTAAKQREDIIAAARKEAQQKIDAVQAENQNTLRQKLAEIDAARNSAEVSLEGEAERLANLMSLRVLSDKGSAYIQ